MNKSHTDEQFIERLTQDFGTQTINEVRAQSNLPPVQNGEMSYVYWMKQSLGLPTRPKLTIVPRILEEDL